MKFEPKDREELAKIGVANVLDLALLLPKSYEDLSLSKIPSNGDVNVKVLTSNHNFGRVLKVKAYCYTWEEEIYLVIFNAKKWHFGAFGFGKELLIHGKANFYGSNWQITNPKIIKDFGGIKAFYKKDLKDSRISNLIEKYVNEENLINFGLKENEARMLVKLHENTKESLEILTHLEEHDEILNLLKFLEIYNYSKKLRSKKRIFKAQSLELNDISTWLSSLPFKPTKDQIKALEDIKNDFLSPNATRRVIMGDVGSGKTLVILGAALLIAPKKSVLMAPTGILAEQIYNEAKNLLPKNIRIKLVKKGDKNISYDEVDFIIGTHVLLYQDLPKCALVMVDEQHRFGSAQRQKINALSSKDEFKPHFLQFSATPIPRTLSLIESNFVKFSFLKLMPFKKTIHTLILQNKGFKELLEHLKEQISLGKQAIIVYPLVEENEDNLYQSLKTAANFWFEHFSKVYMTYGKDKEKDDVISSFAKDGNILLTTTLIEVGISLPKLSSIIIVGAEKLGLATLHQLRGRVGRKGGEGWCFLYTKLKNPPDRLKEFASTLDGFKIAQIDLKNRKAGDIILGSSQHGETFNFYDMEEDLALKAKERLDYK